MKVSLAVTDFDPPMANIVFRGSLDTIFSRTASFGYQGVELFIFSAQGVDADYLKSLLDDNGLEAAMLVAVGDLLSKGLNLSHPDPAMRQAYLDAAPVHLGLASKLGAKVPLGYNRGQLQPGESRAELEDRLAETLCAYHQVAYDLGVTLVLEPLNRFESNYINRVDEALELIRSLGLANLKLLLDTFHMNIEETSLPFAIMQARDHIGHVHFVDSNRGAPGHGHLNMREIYLCLREAGYSGYLGIEAEPRPDAETVAREGVAFVKRLQGELS